MPKSSPVLQWLIQKSILQKSIFHNVFELYITAHAYKCQRNINSNIRFYMHNHKVLNCILNTEQNTQHGTKHINTEQNTEHGTKYLTRNKILNTEQNTQHGTKHKHRTKRTTRNKTHDTEQIINTLL